MKRLSKRAWLLLAALGLAAAGAAFAGGTPPTLSGTVQGAEGFARIGAFAVLPGGTLGEELGSAPLVRGGFELLLDGPPPAAGALGLPGVMGAPRLSAPVAVTPVRLMVYTDARGLGRFAPGERRREVQPQGGELLGVVYASRAVRVEGERGFALTLRPGWNVYTVALGRQLSPRTVGEVALRVLP